MSDEHKSILLEAESLVTGSRRGDYSHPLDNFETTAKMWQAVLKNKLVGQITAEDVGLMMIAAKLAREVDKHKRDNLVDIAGYAETVMMVKDERYRRGLLVETFSEIEQ